MSILRLLTGGLLSALAAIAVPAAAGAANLPCSPCGYGGGGRFTALAVDPRDPMNVLAGSDVAGIFKSTDGGDSFTLAGSGLEGFAVAAIAFHPDHAGEVYTLTDSGLYRSTDNAAHWHLIDGIPAYRERFFGSRLLIFFKNALWAGSDGNGVFRIFSDGGSTAIERADGLTGARIACLAVHRGTLHAATSRGLFRLEGSLWHAAGHGLPVGGTDVIDLAAHATGRLYAVSKTEGLYIFDETARSWRRTQAAYGAARPQAFKALAVDPDDPDRVVMAAHPQTWPYLLLESRSAGSDWFKAGSFSRPAPPLAWREAPEAIEAVVFCPRIAGRMFLADWWNLWRSHDSGRTWQQLTRGLQNAVVNDIRQHPADPETLFMATADNGLLRSTDSGTSWQRVMAGVENGHAMAVAFSQPDGRAMYLLLDPWEKSDRILVYTSADNGKSWRDIGFSIAGLQLPRLPYVSGRATAIVADPRRDGVIYIGTNGYGVFKTADKGRTWASVNAGLDAPYLKSPACLLAHPRRPDTLFAATQGGGIYTTTDGGRTWQRVSTGREFVFALAADPFNPEHLVAACAGKRLLASTDGGATWQESPLPGQRPDHIAAYTLTFDPEVRGSLYVGTLAYNCRAADGLYVSSDGGTTFTAAGLDLPRISINVVASAAGPRPRLLIGFNGIGLYCADTGR